MVLPNPCPAHQRRIYVAGLKAGSLTFHVIQKVGAKRNEMFGGEFLFEVVDHGPLRRKTADLARGTDRAASAFIRRQRTRDAVHAAVIHVPGLGSHMP